MIVKDRRIILAGGGGHALSLIEAAPADCVFGGYLAPEPSCAFPLPYLGDDSAASALAEQGYLFHVSFIYAGHPCMEKRRALISFYNDIGVHFASIISPYAIVTPNSYIAPGCAIMNGAIINRSILLPHVVVNSGAVIEHDCTIGSNSFIAPGVVIGGGVEIGDNCFIGIGAVVRNCVRIAPGVTIAMGTVVTEDLNEPGFYRGFPLSICSKKK